MERISGSLEAHKSDYTMVAELQAENVRLKNEVILLHEESQTLQKELEALKQDHAAHLKTIETANDEKCRAIFNLLFFIVELIESF